MDKTTKKGFIKKFLNCHSEQSEESIYRSFDRCCSLKMTGKKAFTLAEVLITLAIIGVVASLTIPGLIQSQNKSQYVVGLKKAQSVFQQAVQRYMVDNGCIGNINCQGIFDGGNDIKFYNAMRPYLNVAKDCGGAIDEDCWPDDTKLLSGVLDTTPETDGDFDTVIGVNAYGKSILADGFSVMLDNSSISGCNLTYGGDTLKNGCGFIYIDVNGKKSPNIWGRDTFTLYVTEAGQVVPFGTNLFTDASDMKWNDQDRSIFTCDPANFADSGGKSCSGRIAEQGWQMNY